MISPKNALQYGHGRSSSKRVQEKCARKIQPRQKLCEREHGKFFFQKRKRTCKKHPRKNKRGYPSKKSVRKKHQPKSTRREAARLRALEKIHSKEITEKTPQKTVSEHAKSTCEKTNEGNPCKKTHVRRPREKGDRKKPSAKDFSEKRPAIRARQKPQQKSPQKMCREIQPRQNSCEREHEKSFFSEEKENLQKAPAKKQTGITQQEERREESPAKEHTEGGSAIKSTGKNPLKGDHGKNHPKERKRTCKKHLRKNKRGKPPQNSACKKTP